MSLQRKPFDPTSNPFLRTTNPFRIQDKFYTHSSSEQKFKNQLFTNPYDSQCNHCSKNTPLIEELNTRSLLLKAQKQNLHKKPSTLFKNGKLPQNPFEKPRLLEQKTNSTNYSCSQYSRKDQGKLQNLLQNNPFKKYVQERQAPIDGKEMDVEFQKINLIKLNDRNVIEFQKRDDPIKLSGLSQEKRSSARFSIDSMNNFSSGLKSNQNSPHKKSKFSPTFGEIMSYRASSSRRSSNDPPTESRLPCLMKQISKSRKDVFEHKKSDSERSNPVQPKSQNKIIYTPVQELPTKQKHEDPEDVITIKGKKFYRHPVKKYF